MAKPRGARWLAVVGCAGALLAAGCPQLLDDDFSTTKDDGDASLGGSGGAAGADASLGGTAGSAAGAGGGGGTGGTGATGGTGGSAGSDAGPCSSCATGELCCDDTCVNPAISQKHCGACGVACPGTTCATGQCTNICALGFLDCDQNVTTGCEVAAATDPENCGSCGAACSFDQTCAVGKCVCPPGSANCDGTSANGCETTTASDPQNCGACGTSCGANQTCDAGLCACAVGFADCNGSANDGCEADLAQDEQHCGACNTSCGTNGVCSSGACGCLTGFLDCDGATGCESSKTDPASCGACGMSCGAGAPICDGTGCVTGCGSGQTLCGSSCVNLATDPTNCGSCGNAVGANQSCVSGTPTCLAGWDDCNGLAPDGCEADLGSSSVHCGACGNGCKPGAICSSSSCVCAASTPKDCGSACRECCAAGDCSDGNPCTADSCSAGGQCQFSSGCSAGSFCCATGCFECCIDSQCTGGKVCSANQCVQPACTAPEILCATQCVNPSSNAQHCGGCGNDCGVGRTCNAGACTPAWVPSAAAGAPTARSHAAYAALGSSGRVFVWGGADAASTALANGGIYDVATDSWTAVPPDANAPSARVLATAVWTGTRVLVWGGSTTVSGGTDLANGALYDVAAGTWQAITNLGAPTPRRAPYAVLTGAGVLVFGGFTATGQAVGSAWLYDPQQDVWTAVNTAGQPPALLHPTTGFTGTDFLVYGGRTAPTQIDDLYDYRTTTDTWSALAKGPSARFAAFGGWDTNGFVAWGGRKEGGGPPQTYATGRRYDVSQDNWTNMDTTGAPTARYAPHREHGWSARISSGVTLMAGGLAANNSVLTNGGIYNSTTDAWTSVPAWPSGEDHRFGVGVLAGGELVLWGGLDGSTPTAAGERFRP